MHLGILYTYNNLQIYASVINCALHKVHNVVSITYTAETKIEGMNMNECFEQKRIIR